MVLKTNGKSYGFTKKYAIYVLTIWTVLNIAVHMQSYYESALQYKMAVALAHLFIWLAGSILIVLFFIGLMKHQQKITETETQILQSQKMESLGLLAGGIAHDFNNFLTAIIGYSSLLKQELQDSDKTKIEYIRNVLNAAEKAQNLTSGLLSFSRKQFIKPDLIRLGEIVDNISELLKRIIGEHIELRVKHHEREFPVLADSHQIEQVLMNLATNAVDAMPVGGVLSIETVPAIIDSEYAKRYSIKHGNYMVLSVSDTGTGIDKKDIPQIFEPFFTTKDKSRGTGLGLAIVYGIIKQHGGFINVYSEKGIGSAFKIYLPASRENKSERREHMTSWQKTSPLMGSETILVVEDEGTVREFLKDALEAYGYKVITAVDGEDAIEKYGEYKADIDMLILDFILPKKNGKDVYNIINTLNPAIKALFISGYGLDVLTSKGLYERGLEFIEKPIELQILMSKIRSILNME